MKKRIELVYTGTVIHKGDVVHAYYPADTATNLGRAYVYPEPLSDYPPGSVCSYACEGEGAQVFSEGALFVREWDNSDEVASWNAQNDATLMSAKAYQHAEQSETLDILDPIREAYRVLDERGRVQLIANVVRYMTEGI